MILLELILFSSFIARQLVSSKIYNCSSRSFNATESSVWSCCADQLFNMSRQYCSQEGPADCINSKLVIWCDNGHCIYDEWKCDGYNDCRDGSDEFGCNQCKQNEFRCANEVCVDKSAVCNNSNDCGDGSDEFGCPKIGNNGACRYNQFRCNDHSCVSKDAVCDTKNDCGDCSDELGCFKDRVIAKRHEENSIIHTECGYIAEKSVKGAGTILNPRKHFFQRMLIWLLFAILSGL